jgi:2-polyprenyl-3-methyl-5-hydroxy-6-metoxy-1,4-benzoquinol methylase
MIEYLAQAHVSEFPDQWYELGRPDHFWFEWRLRATLRQLAELGIATDRPLRVLDVGAGGGALRDQLEACTSWTIDIADLNATALVQAAAGRGRTMCYDVLRPHPDLLGAYDVVLLFDVLEHIHDRLPFLHATLRHVKPGGHFLMNVPAWQFLYSAYDVAAGHVLRYRKATLAPEMAGTDFDILDMRYWGFLMVPLLLLRKWIVRRAASHNDCVRQGFEPPGRFVHTLLRALARMETALLRRPPMGTSLLLAAHRK